MYTPYPVIGLFALFIYGSPLAAQEMYFPPVSGEQWATTDPAALAYDPVAINELYRYLEDSRSDAFLLLKNGRIVLENYWNDFPPDSVHYWASAGKTLVAAAVGIAEAEGSIDLSVPSSDYLGAGWTDCGEAAEERITVLDHLRMTTGLDEEYEFFCTEPGCLRCIAEPGTRWAYHNGPFTKLHDLIEAATGQTPTQFIRQRFRTRTGITGAYLPLGPDNQVFFSTPRVMARFGLLLLNAGVWDGAPIIPADFHARMIRPSQNINESYGLLTWLNGQPTHIRNGSQEVTAGPLLPDAPSDAYFAAGKNGQFINVAPADGLVWVRVGAEPVEGEEEYVGVDFNNEIWRRVNAVIRQSTGAGEAAGQIAELRVFPNPATGEVRIRGAEGISRYELYDALGRRVRSGRTARIVDAIDVSGLPEGVYRLRAHDAAGRVRGAAVVLR